METEQTTDSPRSALDQEIALIRAGRRISDEARRAHNRRAEFTVNEAWNKAHRAGTYAERVVLQRLSQRLAKHQLSAIDIANARRDGIL